MTDPTSDGLGRRRIPLPAAAEPVDLLTRDGVALAAMHLPHPGAQTAIVVAHGFGELTTRSGWSGSRAFLATTQPWSR